MRKTKQTINISFFPGFYESELSDILNREFENFTSYEAEYRQAENDIPKELRLDESDIISIAFDCMKYRDAEKEIARDWLSAFNHHASELLGFNIRLAFDEMTSPKYYNFKTDRLFAFITKRSIKRLFAISNEDNHATLARVIVERHSSRSGFISFYDNSPEAWLGKPVLSWGDNELATLLCAALVARNYGEDLREFKWSIYESVSEDSYRYFDIAMDWQKFEAMVEEKREEMRQELLSFDPEYVMPAPRCDRTPDLFKSRAWPAELAGVR